MNCLDCHTRKSTISSLCDLFSCSKNDLLSFLENTEFEDDYLPPPNRYIFNKVIKVFGKPKKLDYVCWFHATRTYPGNDFSEGLLPLEQALETMWNTVFEVSKHTEHYSRLKEMKANNDVSDFYKYRISSNTNPGPNAYLIREIAIKAGDKNPHGNYLELSEIIKHICEGYEDKYKTPSVKI